MKIFKKITLGLLIALSLATGLVKIFGMETEMHLFREAGFNDVLTLLFGVIQVLGGILLIFPTWRRAGAIIMVITFCIATAVLFINGQTAFGVFSVLFIAMAVWFIKPVAPKNQNADQ